MMTQNAKFYIYLVHFIQFRPSSPFKFDEDMSKGNYGKIMHLYLLVLFYLLNLIKIKNTCTFYFILEFIFSVANKTDISATLNHLYNDKQIHKQIPK